MRKIKENITQERANIKWENEDYLMTLFYLDNILNKPLNHNFISIKVTAKRDLLPIEVYISDKDSDNVIYSNMEYFNFLTIENKNDIIKKIEIAEKTMIEIKECLKEYI